MKIALAYVPVIHQGIKKFVEKARPDSLYILGKSFLDELDILKRDMRAMSPLEIAHSAQALNIAPHVSLFEKEDISTLGKVEQVICADDEVTRYVAKSYLRGLPVTFEEVFLRWGEMATLSKHPVSEDITVSTEEAHKKHMQEAYREGEKSSDWWRHIGALLVKNGKIIFKNHNTPLPTQQTPYIEGDPRANFNAGEHIELSNALHAEAGLIAEAAQKGISLDGASLFVTTFPCPNCAMLIIRSGIKEVYFSEGYSKLNAQRNFKEAGVKIIRVRD